MLLKVAQSLLCSFTEAPMQHTLFGIGPHSLGCTESLELFLQAVQQVRQLQQQMHKLVDERDSAASLLEAKESQLLGLQAQVDLLRNHSSETEAWLTSM